MHLDLRVNGSTKLTGLIGNPVEHTVSPVLQNSLFSVTGINGVYLPLKVPEGSLRDAVNGLKAVGFAGFNVTIPYKGAIMEYLDEINEEAKLLEAVNTVKITGDRLVGYNTDGDGFLRAFSEQTGTGFTRKSVCILGAGGTARTLAIKIALEGANKICIINRTLSSAIKLTEKINQIISGASAFAAAAGSAESMLALARCDIIINATSVGMHPDTEASPLEEGFSLRQEQIIYDVIYNPVETKLMALARRSGCIAVNGAGMLFYQGVKAFEIWNGSIIPAKKLEDISKIFLKYLQG